GRVRHAGTRVIYHADLRTNRPHEFRIARLIAVEALFARERRHEGFRLLVLVRVFQAQGPDAFRGVLVYAVLVRIDKGLDALPAFEGIELPVRVVVPHLEVPGDRHAGL